MEVYHSARDHPGIDGPNNSATCRSMAPSDSQFLPPYRSLLTPHLKYDYQLHRNIELTSDEISQYNYVYRPYNMEAKTKTKTIKMKYKSLLTDTKKKLFNSDLFSLSSTTTTASTNIAIPYYPVVRASFEALPAEILGLIMWQLRDDQRSLVNCLYVNKAFEKAVKKSLYFNPQFTSTYRVGQFVTTLQENNRLGKYVKYLDLSKLVPGLDWEDNDELDIFQLVFNTDLDNLEALLNNTSNTYNNKEGPSVQARAGWRDWKYRDNPLYGRRIPSLVGKSQPLSRQFTNSTLVSTGSSSTTFKYQHRSRSTSDATLVRQNGEFHEMCRNFDTMISLTSSTPSSSKSSGAMKRSLRHVKRVKRLFKKSKQKVSREETWSQNNGMQLVKFDLKGSRRKPLYEPFTEDHPLTNKFLNKYSITKDLPIGYIIHILTICENIRDLDFSNLSLSADFRIVPEDFKFKPRQLDYEEPFERNSSSNYYIKSLIPSTSQSEENSMSELLAPHHKSKNLKELSPAELSTNFVFLSDLGISTIDHHKKRSLHKSVKMTPLDIIESFSCLPHLQRLSLNNCIWLDKRLILKFLDLYHRQKELSIDFINSGMLKNSSWDIQGTVRDLIEVFRDEERYMRNWESMYSLSHRIGENY